MTLAANVAHGLGHGLPGAAVAAWPAVALVGSYELLMMIIRSAQAPGTVPAVGRAPERMPDTDPLQGQAAQAFAVGLAAGRVPSVRAIRARLHVGQPRARRVRAYLAALNGAQAGASHEHRAGISEVRSAALRDPHEQCEVSACASPTRSAFVGWRTQDRPFSGGSIGAARRRFHRPLTSMP